MRQYSILNADEMQQQCVDKLSLAIDILQLYNIRASELLNITKRCIHEEKYVIVPPSKRSRPVVIRDRYIVSQLVKLARGRHLLLFYPLNYRILYHHIKKHLAHTFDTQFTKKNAKVTHYYRYANCKSLSENEQITAMLNHNSKLSCEYYKSKKRSE